MKLLCGGHKFFDAEGRLRIEVEESGNIWRYDENGEVTIGIDDGTVTIKPPIKLNVPCQNNGGATVIGLSPSKTVYYLGQTGPLDSAGPNPAAQFWWVPQRDGTILCYDREEDIP